MVRHLSLIKTNPHLYPGVGDGGSEFTLTGALVYYILVMLPNFVLELQSLSEL